MKDKIQMTFATLALAVGLLLPAAAQQLNDKNPQSQPAKPLGQVQQYEPVKPKPHYQIKTPLKCDVGVDNRFPSFVAAVNNTGAPLKRGVVIYYSTNNHPDPMKHTLLADLAAGDWVRAGDVFNFQSCNAWFLK